MKLYLVLVIYGTLLTIAQNRTCNVCVMQPVITSSITCPPCNISYVNRDIRNNHVFQPEPPPPELIQEGYPLPGWTVVGASVPERFVTTYRTQQTTCYIIPPRCNFSYPYRTFDASCNNRNHHTWGMSGSAYSRILPAAYEDGQHLIRTAADGKKLPWVRVINNELFEVGDVEEPNVTSAAVAWAQMVTHDYSRGLQQGLFTKDCCNEIYKHNPQDCAPILDPRDDWFYSKCNITCTSLIRSTTTLTGGCNYGPAQQVNLQTSPLDASFIYGASDGISDTFREFKGGRLSTQTYNGQEILPKALFPIRVCDGSNLKDCFGSGDPRVDQNTPLTVHVTLLYREHNRIVGELQKLHREWGDEKLFQEGRKVFIAQFQHIVYNEWLPLSFPDCVLEKYNLLPLKEGYSEYNANINLITINSFANGVFRIFHSAITPDIYMVNDKWKLVKDIPFSNTMKAPRFIFENDNFDQLLRGVLVQHAQKLDNIFTIQINGLAFREGSKCGVDLPSIDMQRSRDHGIAPYVYYLETCTGIRATSFDDLLEVTDKELVEKMKNVYNSVEDVDLYVGSLLERRMGYIPFGPTTACLFIEQVYRTKFGDRFWYEVGGQNHTFTECQLKEIRKSTAAKIYCDNSNIKQIQRSAFRQRSQMNPVVDCGELPVVNLSKCW